MTHVSTVVDGCLGRTGSWLAALAMSVQKPCDREMRSFRRACLCEGGRGERRRQERKRENRPSRLELILGKRSHTPLYGFTFSLLDSLRKVHKQCRAMYWYFGDCHDPPPSVYDEIRGVALPPPPPLIKNQIFFRWVLKRGRQCHDPSFSVHTYFISQPSPPISLRRR